MLPNEIDMDDLESKDELIDTPLLSPFLDSDDESDDGEVLNELDEYGNARNFYPNRIIKSLDGENLAFPIENHFNFDTSNINSQASTRSSIHASVGHDPELEIHSFMIQIQRLSMKFKAFSIHLHNPITIYTCVRYVKAIPTMVMNVRNESRLSMSRNHATIKTFGDNTYPHDSLVNPSFNIQTELDNHELFINELIQQKLQNKFAQPFLAIAITFDLPTVEPEDSLRMRDERLDTILETESDEFIIYIVDNLVPNPSESKDLSDIECDVPVFDDFTTFSNLLFDADDDFSSSDDESFSDEDIQKEIYSNPLFDKEIISMEIYPHHFNAESDLIESLLNHDSMIISSSSKIDSLLDEFVEFISENSDAAIESFSPFPILVEDSDSLMEEINLTLTPDDSMPSGIKDVDYDSEGEMLILEELLSNDSLSLPENESFHFEIPSSPRPPAKPPDDDEVKPNSGILTFKVVGDISEHYVPMPRLLPAQPTLASNQEKSPHI
uniref:Reverse transcriptase domain-containing protein n=1 Tax=Tanacetum cinerariifolium TaxID=118510 RepID=A0A6L2JCB8_TANCI|nr:hypothetical protein [Tanacetum cinerariifolium]